MKYCRTRLSNRFANLVVGKRKMQSVRRTTRVLVLLVAAITPMRALPAHACSCYTEHPSDSRPAVVNQDNEIALNAGCCSKQATSARDANTHCCARSCDDEQCPACCCGSGCQCSVNRPIDAPPAMPTTPVTVSVGEWLERLTASPNSARIAGCDDPRTTECQSQDTPLTELSGRNLSTAYCRFLL